MKRYELSILLPVLLLVAGAGLAAEFDSESGELAELLRLAPGLTAAEVGAGDGEMTVEVAHIVGPAGRVYSTEVKQDKVDDIVEAASEAGVGNVVAVLGEFEDAKLPADCCDAIFMRRVYHHFVAPEAMNASLHAALRPGGRLAVIDFNPRTTYPEVKDVPESRGGHGMPIDLLIEELTAAGFVLEERIDDWRRREYCVVVSKPRG